MHVISSGQDGRVENRLFFFRDGSVCGNTLNAVSSAVAPTYVRYGLTNRLVNSHRCHRLSCMYPLKNGYFGQYQEPIRGDGCEVDRGVIGLGMYDRRMRRYDRNMEANVSWRMRVASGAPRQVMLWIPMRMIYMKPRNHIYCRIQKRQHVRHCDRCASLRPPVDTRPHSQLQIQYIRGQEEWAALS